MRVMTARINFYFAILLITIAGAGATLTIVHTAYNNQFNVLASKNGNEASYAALQAQILKKNN